MAQNPLVGTWRLVSLEFREEDGTVTYPYGQDALGYLIYGPDGFMSGTLMAANRPRSSPPDIALLTTEEKVAAFDTYLSYCGSYEVGDGQVFHHIELATSPNMVGWEQTRFFKLEGERLTIFTDPFLQFGKVRASYLVWRQVSQGAVTPEHQRVSERVTYPRSTEGRGVEQVTPSSVDRNKAVVRHMIEDLLNGNRPDLVGEVFSTEAKAGGSVVRHEQIAQAISHHHSEISGFQYIIDELIGEGDTVVVRGFYRGTQIGEMSVGGVTIPPTGKPVECPVFDLYRLRDQKIVEEIAMGDDLGLLQQLGFVPIKAPPLEADP